MLGYDLRTVGAPYIKLVTVSSVAAYVLALGGMFAMRWSYLGAITGLGAEPRGVLVSVLTGAALTALIVAFNIVAVRRKVRSAWRL